MQAIILPATLATAAAAALCNLWLAMRIGALRNREKVLIGDGGHPLLIARMRAQANFVEYTPIFLILMALVELAGGMTLALWIIGALYIVARILHGLGLDKPTINALRGIGIGVTLLTTLILAGWAVSLAWAAMP
ncbi:MAPEG family protein [Stakelama tenebrarum]|uniref:MAPEG family protein n=1 Tax=Stakelama tenebrarum TaxID=2711215 RepID=A0A6G6Y1R6_9SPHN|nr:MAPEG family protein [Sphingosinithalassobacter tenebrarum]QIG78516.1 MAPEG family protein [Sphingosinithalassobacter tenebrarum]